MTLKRSIVFGGASAIQTIIDLSREAEAAGFHRVWTTENHSRDAMLRAAAIALNTRTIQIGTGIAYAFTRAPLNLATATAEMQVLSHGRFTLGLGAMTRGMRRNWYDIEIDHPASRLKEYAEFLRAAFVAEGGFTFAGRFYRADVPAFDLIGDPDLIRATRIYGSGVNAAMIKACADSCDGLALHPLASALAYYDELVAPALRRSGRPIEIAIWRITCVDEDAEVARAAARKQIAFYLSTPSYRTVGEVLGWESRVGQIQHAFRMSAPPIDWRPIAALVTDEMLQELALAGTPPQVRDQAVALEADYERRGAREIVFQAPGTDASEQQLRESQRRTMETFRPRAATAQERVGG